VEAHADPEGLENLVIFLDDVPVCGERVAENAPGAFRVGSMLLDAHARLEHLRQGSARLRAVATWKNGEVKEVERTVQYDFREMPEPATLRSGPATAALMFRGQSQSHDTRRWFLREDGKRGDTWITLTDAAEFAPGEILQISTRPDDDWPAQLESARPSVPRLGRFVVEEVERNRVRLNQPLRLDFPAAGQASLVTLCEPLRFCAVENLTLEQRGALPLDAIAFEEAFGCRVEGVTVNRAGRAPLSLRFAKFCEIRDCRFEDSWNGTEQQAGRVGFYAGWDCLMENVTVMDLPQSPYFAWSASGNVVRDSRFTGTGAFFGGGWAHENLVENCRIDANTARHAGHAVFASRPENPETGPGGGPRNVFYNNALRSSRSGIFLGGMNEGWIFLANRLVVRSGSALETRMHSLGHTFTQNTVSLAQPWQPAFRLHDADCLETRITENVVYGTTRKIAGRGIPVLDENEFVEGYLPETMLEPVVKDRPSLSRPENVSPPITH
jgi:hypothetical protein